MKKIEQIKQAIANAEKRQSKLTMEALNVPALSSLMLRALMNNLGAISTHYMEHGVHRGGLFCSTIFNNENLLTATAVDNFESDDISGEHAMPDFMQNVKTCIPQSLTNRFLLIRRNSFDVPSSQIGAPIDLYLFDADHSEDSQCRALTHFISAMAEEFIFCVDDYDWPEVQMGTHRGIIETEVDILFEHIFQGNNHDNEGAWNGFYVALLKKKS